MDEDGVRVSTPYNPLDGGFRPYRQTVLALVHDPADNLALWKRMALSLWLTSLILFFPLLLPLMEPSVLPALLAEHWQDYGLLFLFPFALGAFCWHRADRAYRK